MRNFNQKVCVVTGAGSGIGAACAKALAAEGAQVVLTDIRGDMLDACVKDITQAGGIDKFGIFRHQLIFQMRCAAIERDAFNTAMSTGINLATGCFIHAARFHADKAVLNQIKAANAMLTAKIIQRSK